MVRWLLAATHLLALAIGLGAIWTRSRALGQSRTAVDLPAVFYADNWWAVAALLWLVTGLIRAVGGFEKGTEYYLHNHIFLAKMGGFLLVVALELKPMLTLMSWRRRLKLGQPIDLGPAPGLATISRIQAALLILLLLAATAMARGYGS